MTSRSLPIFGQGSQPTEEDGAELEYMPMPEEMSTYRMPQISSDLNTENLAQAKSAALQLEAHLSSFPAVNPPITLTDLDQCNRHFIDELLGEGEVSMICSGATNIKIQEAVLAGVWRVQQFNDQGQRITDLLEVGLIPEKIVDMAFAESAAQIDTDLSQQPEGVMNAPPLLAELNGKIAEYQPGAEPHIINLSLLPQTDQDLAFLETKLGSGPVTILSRGYGNCRITATGIRNVWWVRYYNSQDTLILNTLEVSDVPSVACASAEDIADSHQRLQEILKVYL